MPNLFDRIRKDYSVESSNKTTNLFDRIRTEYAPEIYGESTPGIYEPSATKRPTGTMDILSGTGNVLDERNVVEPEQSQEKIDLAERIGDTGPVELIPFFGRMEHPATKARIAEESLAEGTKPSIPGYPAIYPKDTQAEKIKFFDKGKTPTEQIVTPEQSMLEEGSFLYDRVQSIGGTPGTRVPLSEYDVSKLQDDIKSYKDRVKKYESRGMTIPAQVYDVLEKMVPFAGEIAATGPLRAAATAPVKAAGTALLKKMGTKAPTIAKEAVKAGTRVAAGAAGAAGTSIGLVPMMQNRYDELRLAGVGKNEAVWKAVVDGYAEAFSEMSGADIARYGGGAIAKIPGIEKGYKYAKDKINKVLEAFYPDKKKNFDSVLESIGYHGVLQEMGEEVLGDALRTLFGTQSASDIIPSAEELLVQGIAFSILPIASNMAGGIGYKERVDDILNEPDPKKQKDKIKDLEDWIEKTTAAQEQNKDQEATPKPKEPVKPAEPAGKVDETIEPEELIYASSGKPYNTAAAAAARVKVLKTKGIEAEPVQVEGGWAIRKKKGVITDAVQGKEEDEGQGEGERQDEGILSTTPSTPTQAEAEPVVSSPGKPLPVTKPLPSDKELKAMSDNELAKFEFDYNKLLSDKFPLKEDSEEYKNILKLRSLVEEREKQAEQVKPGTRRKVLDAIYEADKPLSINDIVSKVGGDLNAVGLELDALEKQKKIKWDKVSRTYTLALPEEKKQGTVIKLAKPIPEMTVAEIEEQIAKVGSYIDSLPDGTPQETMSAYDKILGDLESEFDKRNRGLKPEPTGKESLIVEEEKPVYQKPKTIPLAERKTKILEMLEGSDSPIQIDAITLKLETNANDVSSALTMLEMEGKVIRESGMRFTTPREKQPEEKPPKKTPGKKKQQPKTKPVAIEEPKSDGKKPKQPMVTVNGKSLPVSSDDPVIKLGVAYKYYTSKYPGGTIILPKDYVIPSFNNYDEAQKEIDNYTDELDKKYGNHEGSDLQHTSLIGGFSGLKSEDTKLTNNEIMKMRSLYWARDRIGDKESNIVFDDVFNKVKKINKPVDPEVVKDSLKKIYDEITFSGAMHPNTPPTKSQVYDWASYIYADLAEAYKPHAIDTYNLADAIEESRSQGFWGYNPTPVIEQTFKIIDVVFGRKVERPGTTTVAESSTVQEEETQELSQAYNELTDYGKGFSGVEIYNLHKKSGISLEKVKQIILALRKEGKANLHTGDWSLSSKEVKSGAITEGEEKYTLVDLRNLIKKPPGKKKHPESIISDQIDKTLEGLSWHEAYKKIKEYDKDTILFFRVGDFYETFDDDAKVLNKELNAEITKPKDNTAFYLAGVVYHQIDSAQKSLEEKGYKTKIIDLSSKDKKQETKPTVAESTTGQKDSDPGLRFSTKPSGKGQPVETVKRYVKKLQENKNFKYPIRVTPSIHQWPEPYRKFAIAEQKKGNVIRGMYVPETREVWVAADGIADRREALTVIMHEVFGHHGIRLVSEETGSDFNSFLDWIANGKYRDEVLEMAKEEGWDTRKAADEWFAQQVESGKVPDGIWNRFVAWVKKWLRKMGFNIEFGKADLEELIRRSHEAVRKEAAQGAQSERLFESPAFSESEPKPEFYSQMEQVLSKKLPNTGTGESYRNIIQNWMKKGEYKQEEVDFVGILDDPNSPLNQKGKISKADVIKWIQLNNLQVEEVQYPNKKYAETFPVYRDFDSFGYLDIEQINEEEFRLLVDDDITNITGEQFSSTDDGDVWVLYTVELEGDNGRKYEEYFVESPNEWRSGYDKFEDYNDAKRSIYTDTKELYERLSKDEEDDTKYASYQLEGKSENYRELLFTLPETGSAKRLGELQILEHDAEEEGNAQDAERYHQEALQISQGSTIGKMNYYSSHWEDIPNVLAHVRLNDRIDADGKKVLFVEEIQSDWLQDLRELEKEKEELLESKPNGYQDKVKAIETKLAQPMFQGVPMKESRQWGLFAFKKIIRMAAEGGYDRIAWTTGIQQVERYENDLRKKVDEIKWEKKGNYIYVDAFKSDASVFHYPFNSQTGLMVDTIKGKNPHLSEVVGKSMAKQILSSEEKSGSFKGDDLTIGGEGMKGFYDEILPNTVNRYVKKWGAKAGTTDISNSDKYLTEVREIDGEFWLVDVDVRPGDESLAGEPFPTREAAEKEKREWNQGVIVHSVDVTPQMQQAALMGQPLFSTKKKKPRPAQPPSFVLDPMARIDHVRKALEQQYHRLSMVQDAILKAKGKEKLPVRMDALLETTLHPGRVGEEIRKFEEKVIFGKNSMLQRMIKDNVDIDDLGIYLQAMDAISWRNETILARSGVENGSGLTNDEALDIIDKFNDTKVPLYAEEAWEFIRESEQKRYEAGVITNEEHEVFTKREFYAPAKGFSNIPKKDKERISKKAGTGKGFTTRFSEYYRAKGRTSMPENPFVQAIVDYAEAIIVIDKNNTEQAFLELIIANPNQDVWTEELLKWHPIYDKNGELLYMKPDFKPADNIMLIRVQGDRFHGKKIGGIKRDGEKIHGHRVKVTLNDPELAKAMRRLSMENPDGMTMQVGRMVRSAMNILRASYTYLSPEFILITNMERDIQQALINMTAEQSAKVAGRAAKGLPSAMKMIFDSSFRNKVNEFNEYKDLGLAMGWWSLDNVDEKVENIKKFIALHKKELKFANSRIMLKRVGDFITDINQVVEMGIRVSYVRELIKEGVPPKRAIAAGRDLTVDFNRHGTWGQTLSMFWLFANASLQGTSKIFRLMGVPGRPKNKVQKTMQGIIGGMGTTGFVYSLINRLLDPDDWDQMDDWVKDNHWLIPTKWAGGEGYLSARVPYGNNVFFVMGQLTEEAVFGDIGVWDFVSRLLSAANNSFNPFGSSDPVIGVLPTVFKPFAEWLKNTNFMGGPIYKERGDYEDDKPDTQMFFRGVSPITKYSTQWLNDITGGTKKEKGSIDVNPETIDHFITAFTGGLGKFAFNTVGTTASVITGEVPKAENIPIVRQFMKYPSEWKAKTIAVDMKKESGSELFSPRKEKRFLRNLNYAYEHGQITEAYRNELLKGYRKNQAEILNERDKRRSMNFSEYIAQ